ncbi:unnamed protein product, partial [Brenthis ino]
MIADLQVEKEYRLFDNFSRISSQDFEWLLNGIGPEILEKDTNYREAIRCTLWWSWLRSFKRTVSKLTMAW